MTHFFIRIILKYRLAHLIVIGLITVFMAFQTTKIKLSYEMAQILPDSDSSQIAYRQFKEIFGEDGSVLFVGIKDKDIFEIEKFRTWYDLTHKIKSIDGVQEVVSLAHIFEVVKNDSLQRYDFVPVFNKFPDSQLELDSLKNKILSLSFYDGLLFNQESGATLMAVTLDNAILNTKGRLPIVKEVTDAVEYFNKESGIEHHLSGLPFIRTSVMKKIQSELKLFMFLAVLIASVALFIFFRSFKAVIFPMIIVGITVVIAMGMMVLFDYKITILTGVFPPLLIVIGVENCIFLLNKFHQEYRAHGNKVKALSRMLHRVGNAAFLTNLTTATGFATFILTGNKMLVEFGTIASINIMVIYLLTIILIPIFFSYLDPPSQKHVRHLDNNFTIRLLEKIVHIVLNHRQKVYVTAIVVTLIGIVGITRLKTSGNVVDDIPKKDKLYQDLLFFEREFNGVLPFEIQIDTGKKRGVTQLTTIRKINQLQDSLALYSEFSRPLSVAEITKFLRQAFYNGNMAMYDLPTPNEQGFILRYVPGMEDQRRSIMNSIMDKDMQITRISIQMANLGTHEIKRITDEITPTINSIFPPDQYKVILTGTSVVFLKGTDYLVKNLMTSLIFAIIAISLMMLMLFTSFKVVAISMVPNLLPQILTAAMMGFFAISIKPSTILIFSVALGISVDNAIHYLSRYRLILKQTNWNIHDSVIAALRETGFSMIYSSIVLFFGFAIFTLSTFGGTEAMGFLISFTLLIAVLSNLFVLPSLLLSFDKRITTKKFEEPIIEIFDAEYEFKGRENAQKLAETNKA
ncbi:MAG TPA: MMPL family transporter [Bacteroidales bacterium]|nr:MMPL family transporter [Bacteroidales bacterium]